MTNVLIFFLGVFFLAGGYYLIKKENVLPGIGALLLGLIIMGASVSSSDEEDEVSNDYNVPFKGSQTGYTGKCKKCTTCPGYDRSPDGICECGHYRTDHVWHN